MKNRFSGAVVLPSLLGCSGAFSPVLHRSVQQYQATGSKTSSVSLDMSAEMDSFLPVLLGLGAFVGTVRPDFVQDLVDRPPSSEASGSSGAASSGGSSGTATGGISSSGSTGSGGSSTGDSSAAGSGAGSVGNSTPSPGGGGGGSSSSGGSSAVVKPPVLPVNNAGSGSSSSTENDGEFNICGSVYQLTRALLFPWSGIFRK